MTTTDHRVFRIVGPTEKRLSRNRSLIRPPSVTRISLLEPKLPKTRRLVSSRSQPRRRRRLAVRVSAVETRVDLDLKEEEGRSRGRGLDQVWREGAGYLLCILSSLLYSGERLYVCNTFVPSISSQFRWERRVCASSQICFAVGLSYLLSDLTVY